MIPDSSGSGPPPAEPNERPLRRADAAQPHGAQPPAAQAHGAQPHAAVRAHAAERAGKMVGRVQRRLRRSGVEPAVAGRILAVVDAALDHRCDLVDDDHDHRLLHPARTVLVLMDDHGVVDPFLLKAGAALETRFPDMALPGERRIGLGMEPGPLDRLPDPGWSGDEDDAGLLEELVSLDPGVLTVALAEALDQIRHLHVEPGRPALGRGAVLARDVYRPLAHRVDPDGAGLARRFDWWLRRVGRGVLSD